MPTVEDYREIDGRFREDLPHYCGKLVRIRDKEGRTRPLRLNAAQRILDAAIVDQLDRRGLVRKIVLKGRQLGISTYTCARFYRGTTMWSGRRTYILTHEDKATQNLFGMVKMVHEHMDPEFRPKATAFNANELDFKGIEAGYRVGTAKNIAGGGRSQTFQQFHGSEVAFWPHAETHFMGAMQALPLLHGTEAILESTANGVGGVYYAQWRLAERGQSDFEPVFLPWFLGEDYRRPLDDSFDPSIEEEEYARLYKLDEEQLCWLHYKNIELGGDPGVLSAEFKQEYPATAAEAFQMTGTDSFITGPLVLAARNQTLDEQPHEPRVLGVDIARGGGDLTRLIDRRGRVAGRHINETMDTRDLTEVADRIMLHLQRNPDIAMAFIDITGMGAGVYDIVRQTYAKRVQGVDFGGRATEPERYVNKRAEMWARMKEWLQSPGGVDIPDDDVLHAHLIAPGFRYRAMGATRLQLEAKEDIKKRLQFSPDSGDGLALTFAAAVVLPDERKPSWTDDLDMYRSGSGQDWMTR